MSAHKARTPGTGGTPAAEVPADATVQTAGVFDIRNFIGALLGLFGLILVGAGAFAFDEGAAAKTDGLNANLWAGIAMLVIGILFVVWTKLDPIRMVVRDNEGGAEAPHDISALD